MNINTKLAIVGFGYWGKIIFSNLVQLGYNNIVISDTREIDWSQIGTKRFSIKDYRKIDCENIFIITPVTTHYEICRFFLEKGCNIFCEKPLDTNITNCQKLFDLANKNNSVLFVDWLFLFNPAILKLKELIDNIGPPKSIIANRMNFGPIRNDTDAKWDLASHDVSICNFLLSGIPSKVNWVDFRRDHTSLTNDSVVGILEYMNTNVQINCSWSHSIKNRLYTLDFGNHIVTWDDTIKKIYNNNEEIYFDQSSPLHNSINKFLSNSCLSPETTLNINKVLINENFI